MPAEADGSFDASVPAFVLTVIGGLPTRNHTLVPGPTVVGRSSEVDWQLKHPEISRRHCRFDFGYDGICTLEDLGSRWGTKINGATLVPEVCAPLHPGDRIHIGPVQIFFGVGPAPPELISGSAADGASLVPPDFSGPQVMMDGREVQVIPLGNLVRIGRQGEVDVVLADPGISRQHATVERTQTGYRVTDSRSRGGSFINGRRFESHQLVIGDQLQFGRFFFRFDGQALERTTGANGVAVEVEGVRMFYGGHKVLDDVNFSVDRATFVAILGPSGAGKSSLLHTLTGLRPADAGVVSYDGTNLYAEYDRLRALLGYVPQDDIVHRELTVTQALTYSARLRLPAGTPAIELAKLVSQTVERLGLAEHAHAVIGTLSGGQRKRVSVAVELLGRPAILFLDEPTSGLDPSAEFKLMGLLRQLADGGCTVVCTTHVVENVYLTDRVFVMTGGRLVFAGDAAEAKGFFEVTKLSLLYARLEERTSEDWHRDFVRREEEREKLETPSSAGADITHQPAVRPPPANHFGSSLRTLLLRQWALLRADPKNFPILFGQPLLIGALVVWVTDSTSLTLFFAYLATLWFGCSNAAQEIVCELPIYRRERMVGLGRDAYLLSKFLSLGALTALQGAFLYACLAAGRWLIYPDALPARGLDGSPLWQGGAVILIGLAAAGIGLAISALARTAMQAVMLVPLVLIPQILFSGLVVETGDMPPSAFMLTNVMPSYAAQTMMDVGAFWERPVTGDLYLRRQKAREHLLFLLRGELKESLPVERVGEARDLAKGAFAMGHTYDRADLGMWGALKLVGWTLAGYATAWLALRAKERMD